MKAAVYIPRERDEITLMHEKNSVGKGPANLMVDRCGGGRGSRG